MKDGAPGLLEKMFLHDMEKLWVNTEKPLGPLKAWFPLDRNLTVKSHGQKRF